MLHPAPSQLLLVSILQGHRRRKGTVRERQFEARLGNACLLFYLAGIIHLPNYRV